MWFVLVIAILVIAGWIFIANSDKVARTGDTGLDDRLPANAYENPYDTNENNDRPFEPDASDASSGDSDSCGGSDSENNSSD